MDDDAYKRGRHDAMTEVMAILGNLTIDFSPNGAATAGTLLRLGMTMGRLERLAQAAGVDVQFGASSIDEVKGG